MSWLSRNRHWLLLALVAVTTVLVGGTVVVGLLSVLAALVGGAGLGTALGNAALVLLIAALLTAADLAFALAFLVTVARRVSVPALPSPPESERIANGFERIERAIPPVARLGLSETFAVSTETKRERLTQRYVDDEITQVEYEQRLRALLAAESDDDSITDVDELDADLAADRPSRSDESTSNSAPEPGELADIDAEHEYS